MKYLFCKPKKKLIIALKWFYSKQFAIFFLLFSQQINYNKTGQRIATMLMYLSDNFDGGETYFPMVNFLLLEVFI